MKNTSLLLVLLIICGSCTQSYDKKLSDILLELDEAILSKKVYEQNKEQRISGIKSLLNKESTPEQQYDISQSLLQEYFDYNLDSAMVYAKQQLVAAQQLNQPEAESKSILDLANVCIMVGMLHEAYTLLEQISFPELPHSLQSEYYACHHIFYKHMEFACNDPDLLKQYDALKEEYRLKVLKLTQHDEFRRTLIEASLLRNNEDFRGVIGLLGPIYENWELSTREKSTLSFLIARAYMEMGDPEEAMYYYASGAICDIQLPVNEHESLYTLSSIIFEKGDLERAYRYINCSMEGVLQINSRKNIYNINQLLPLISNSYNSQIHQQRNQLIILFAGSSLLLILLIIAVFAIYKSFKKISLARLEQSRTNEELQRVNTKLLHTNDTLLEANNIKEAYIGRYLDLCSNYISGVEQYRVHLNNILRKDGTTELTKVLKSSTYMKDELDEFYTNFDATFLHLFPNFVEQFNQLLQEDKRFDLKPGELLNTELRVFALIRLGITDSIKIAEFLRRSTSTIYNYRVKMRNAALNSRQDFEKQVIHIGNINV